MRTKEELLKELSTINKEIAEKVRRQAELYRELDSLDDAYDWVSVSKAASIIGMSGSYIYKLVNANRLSMKRNGRKIFVRKSEIERMNDEAYR